MLELHPGVDAIDDVAILARGRPPPLIVDNEFRARQRVVDHVIVALLVAERGVGVDLPDRLGGRRHVRAGCDLLVACFHQALAIGPKMHGLIAKRVSCLDVPLGIELRVERILHGPLADAGEECRLVVAGVRADVAAMPAEAPRECQHQEQRAVLVVVVPELVGAHAAGDQRMPVARRHCARKRLMALAGAQVTLLACSGVILASRYSFVRSKTGRASTFLPSASVTSKRPSSAGSMPAIFTNCSPIASREMASGASWPRPTHKIAELARQRFRHLHAVLLDRRRWVIVLGDDVDPVRKRLAA